MDSRVRPKANIYCDKNRLHRYTSAELSVSSVVSFRLEKTIFVFTISLESAVQVHPDEF